MKEIALIDGEQIEIHHRCPIENLDTKQEMEREFVYLGKGWIVIHGFVQWDMGQHYFFSDTPKSETILVL
jgi:calcineurin-like phosphoesterase family protein